MSAINEYLRRIGKRGGKAKSAEKAAASRNNIEKANAVRRRKRAALKCAIVQGGGATD